MRDIVGVRIRASTSSNGTPVDLYEAFGRSMMYIHKLALTTSLAVINMVIEHPPGFHCLVDGLVYSHWLLIYF